MTSQAYLVGVGSIKEQLSKYSHLSVLNFTLRHMNEKPKDPLHINANMPWVIMFMLKVSLLGSNGREEITHREFIRIANQIFHLQGKAADLNSENIELSLRAMILSQMLYQKDMLNGLRDLFVQGSLFTRSDNYYDDVFFKVFGLSLDSYLQMSMFVAVRIEAQQDKGIIKMPLSDLLFYMCPKIPYPHLLAFIRLVSCSATDLAGFVEGHDLGGIFASEYFQETPFKYIPFILEGSELVAFSYRFCITAMCGLAPAVLKKEFPAFKNKFGADMESRVGELLGVLEYDCFMCESDLQELLRSEGIAGKVVDYVVREGDQVTLVECKAIEPTDLMKCTADAGILKRSLEQNYIKAIHQGQAVADALAGLPQFEGCSFRLLVVTYGDHYIFGGKFISDNIDKNLLGDISNAYGKLPMPLDKVSYLALQDFAGLIYGLKEKGRLLAAFLDAACDAQESPQTRRMSLAHVVEDDLGVVPGSFAAGLDGEMGRKSAALQTLLSENTRHWNGKAEHFMKMHGSLMQALNPSYQDINFG